MIHYHGTPVGGTKAGAVEFLKGRHALVPFPRRDDLHVVAEMCQSFVFDNGAFTVWKQGGKLDIPGYIKWCEEWRHHPGFDWALIPDVIDGTEAENDAMIRDWPADIRGVPVWHMHESVERLLHLAQDWEIVALGSSGQWSHPGSNAWWDRMTEVMDLLTAGRNGRPPCKLHGLRMLNPKIFSVLPLASADSTNASVNSGSKSRFGMYVPPTSGQRASIIAERIESLNSAPRWMGKNADWSINFDDQEAETL
jgi:hypothetical protein